MSNWYPTNTPQDVLFTIGAEAANVINLGIQLKDVGGADLNGVGYIRLFLSDDSGGLGLSGTAATSSLAVGADGAVIKEITTGLDAFLQSEIDGAIDIDIEYTTGAKTWYAVAVLPDGSHVVSDAIIFAA